MGLKNSKSKIEITNYPVLVMLMPKHNHTPSKDYAESIIPWITLSLGMLNTQQNRYASKLVRW